MKKKKLIKKLKEDIKFLWVMLDNIDTAGDIFKPENNGYFKYVNEQCSSRFYIMYSKHGRKLKFTKREHANEDTKYNQDNNNKEQ